MKRSMMLVAAAALGVGATIPAMAVAQQGMQERDRAGAGDAQFYAMTTCPVSGNPLGEGAVTKVYDGREVRFCCENCPERFEENQAAFMATMDAKLIAQQRWDWPLTTCPVSGHELGEGGEPVEMIVGTRFVKLCCDGCIEDFVANSAEYFKEIDKAIADAQRDDYPLTTCVISGEELGSMGEPVEIVIGTTLVRLCCKGCLPKVAKAPWDTLKKVHAAR